MGLQLLDYPPNILLYRFHFLKNLIVPESENIKSSRPQFLRAIFFIPCLLPMLPSVRLDYQFVFQADKVEDIIAKRMLMAELKTRNLSAPENFPQSLFRIRHVIT